MVHLPACLLLTCLAGVFASEREQGGAELETPYGPSSVQISGVDTVTVGVPYGFECRASCSPPCRFSWSRGGLSSQGPELDLLLRERTAPQVLSCTALNPATGKSLTVRKTLQVTAGPSHIEISGPPMLTVGAESRFECRADCFPPCSYTWSVTWQGEALRGAQGNTTSVLPPETANYESLTCQAQNPVSKLFISKTLQVWVARLLDIYITGPSTVTIGDKYTFICFVTCTPSCDYTWTFDNKTLYGDQIQLPVFHKGEKPKVASELEISISDYASRKALTCQARNTASGATANTTKILNVIDPISVHPASEAPPVAGRPLSLQCVGSQNPASIKWLHNGVPVAASQRISDSAHNTTLTFRPLLQADAGLYQCVVSEGGASITSLGYQLSVNFGPDHVVMVRANGSLVGEQLYVLPGSGTALRCLADCHPACSFTWWYDGRLLANNTSILFSPASLQHRRALICVALNSVTRSISTAETTVVLPVGPDNVTVSGPGSLEVGVQASFRCSASCVPACSFTWSVYGKEVSGSVIDVTLNRYVSTESISCRAQNIVSGRTAAVNETLSVSEPLWCGC